MRVPSNLPPPDEREVQSFSPEARRRHALYSAGFAATEPEKQTWWQHLVSLVSPGTRAFEVIRRTAVGTYNDGFIHAGNLAYLSMLAIFPFFILGAAVFELAGGREQADKLTDTVLMAVPPTVAGAIAPVAEDVMHAREGWLLWLGAGVALWTVSSLIETIRDILRRAYGTRAIYAFWKSRLLSFGLILGAVVLLMVSLFAQVAIGMAQQVIDAYFPQLSEAIATLRLSRVVPAIGLAVSLYLVFYSLTPAEYRKRKYPKWPGALFTTLWWLGVTTAMPPLLRSIVSYDLTYGSLAGIIIALFFFWLVGLGLVIGAELNAALAEPEPCDGAATEGDAEYCGEMSEESAG
ncbi:MAG: YihY/virulence factor BrkB family protein [Pseudomonadota bacterium]